MMAFAVKKEVKMKISRFLALTLILIMCFSMVGCDVLFGSRAVPLAAPTNVNVSGNLLSWNFVEHASGYTVKIVSGENADINTVEGREVAVTDTQYSLASLTAGKYTVGVKARGDGILYSNSDYKSVQYTHVVSEGGGENEGGSESKDVVGPFGSFSEVNTKSSFLGYGINVIYADSISSKNVLMNYSIFDMDKLMNENLLMSSEYSGKLEVIEGSTVEEFKQKLSNSTSVSAGHAVSGSANIYGVDVSAEVALSGGVSTSFKQSTANSYSHYFLELISENRNYWLILQSDEQTYKELLSDGFMADLYNPNFSAEDLFSKYGTHVLLGAAMGGNITMFYTLYSESSDVTTEQYMEVATALKTSAEASYGPYSAGTSASLETKDIQDAYNKATSYNIRIEKNIIITGGSGSLGMQDEASIRANYGEWQKSLVSSPVLSGIKDSNSLYPIWKLIDTTVPGGAERAEELARHFAEYGNEAYNNMLELHSIKPPVAPESIENVNVKDVVNYKEGQEVQVRAGDSFRITYEVKPGNASKYFKSLVSDSEFVTVTEDGLVTVSEDILHGTTAKITLTVGSLKLDISLIAVRSYSVEFVTGVDGITVDKLVGIPYGNYIDEPVVSREGWILSGWYTDLGRKNLFNFESDYIKGNITLYAKWEAIKPTVTYDSCGGSAVAAQIVAYNGKVTRPKDPTRSGYTFAGWYTDEECTEAFDFDTLIKCDTELYSKWDIKTYTVTFITDGTDVAPVTTDIERDYLIPEQTTEKSYYDFIGWFKEDGVKFNFSEKVTSDMTLTARWQIRQIPVRFMDEDGTTELGVVYTDISKGFKIDGAPTVTKDGYVFMGWRESTTAVNFITDFTGYEFSTDGKDYVFYAKWVDVDHAYPVPLIINYLFEDGSVAHAAFVDGENYYCDDEFRIESPEIAGYIPDIAVAEGTILVGGITVNVTYSPQSYKLTVNYTMEDGSEAPESYEESYKYGAAYSIESPEVIGYTPSVAVVTGNMGIDNITVTVTYKANIYTIIYNANGASGSMEPQIMGYGVDGIICNNLFSLDNGTFIGWNTKADGSGVTYKPGESVINLSAEQGGEVNLYAMWVEVSMSDNVVIDSSERVKTDVSWSGLDTGAITFGELYEIPVPSAEYYIFDGWYTEDGVQLTNSSGASVGSWTLIGNVKIVAKWSKTAPQYTYLANVADLKEIVMNQAGVKYMLVDDIKFSDDEMWTKLSGKFMGEIEGQYKSIIGLRSSATLNNNGENYGIFEELDGATIKNISFVNISVITDNAAKNTKATYNVGALAGYARNSTIEGINIESGSIRLNGSWNGVANVGGIIGSANSCTFKSCVNNAEVYGVKHYIKTGGIVAYAVGTAERNVEIIACENYGAISAYVCDDVGYGFTAGIAGLIDNNYYVFDSTGCVNKGVLICSKTITGLAYGKLRDLYCTGSN